VDKKTEINVGVVNRIEQEMIHIDSKTWVEYEVFTWNWWILTSLFIFPWLIWAKLAKRESIVEALLFGSIITIATTLFDLIGEQLGAWAYPTVFIPVMPRGLVFDLSMVPVAYMLIYQYFVSWKSFLIALVIMAILYAFIGEPFANWAELVFYKKWHYIGSFCYYITAGVVTRLVVTRLISLKNTHIATKR
jgi:hypothetical protein